MAAQGLTLIGSAAWTFRSFRNLWMLEELGVEYGHVPAFPRDKDAFAANPFGKIPALRDGEFTMYESAAINTYLGDKHRAALGDEACLVPAPATPARGRYEQLCAAVMAELDSGGLGLHDRHSRDGRNGQAIPAAVASAEARFAAAVEIMAAELVGSGGGHFLLGEQFTAADILLVATLDWAEHPDYAWVSWTHDSAISRYLERCRGRPAYRKAKKQGGWLSSM